MDFKGHVEMRAGGRCHPLTVLDDHSRYALCIAACANEQTQTVQDRLTETFQRYGLPERMTMDNGSPWGDGPYGGGLHAADGLADAPGRALRAFAALPSADPRQGRADAPIDASRGDAKGSRGPGGLAGASSTPGASSTTPRGRIRRSITPCRRNAINPARAPGPDACSNPNTAPTTSSAACSRTAGSPSRDIPSRFPRPSRRSAIALRPTADDGVWDVDLRRAAHLAGQPARCAAQRENCQPFLRTRVILVSTPTQHPQTAARQGARHVIFAAPRIGMVNHPDARRKNPTCYPCPRTPVTLVSGPNKEAGRGACVLDFGVVMSIHEKM